MVNWYYAEPDDIVGYPCEMKPVPVWFPPKPKHRQRPRDPKTHRFISRLTAEKIGVQCIP